MSKKRQHYIPQMILRNFTYFRVPMAIPRICYFDTFTKQTKLVTPKDICCKNNLYELKNDSDEFIYENLIENNLSLLEKEWSLIINKLKNK